MSGQSGGRRKKPTGNGAAPAPLTPGDCNLSGYQSMLIDIPRLRQSDFDATTDDTAWRAGLNLWFSAWESVPAGSLRSDDASLAKAAGLGRDLTTWARVKDVAMAGFVLCSDGRVYHRTVCALALGIWIDKLIRRHAGQRGNQKQYGRDLDLASIERQIIAAGAQLAALDPLAPAIVKALRYKSQCEPRAEAPPPARELH